MRDQLLIQPTSEGIQEAANLIQQGKLVAFPTETVYGLGASALNPEAVLSIFEAKGRPLTDPLIVHTSSLQMALDFVDLNTSTSSSNCSERDLFQLLGEHFWPGPLTIISKASSAIPLLVTANTGFVGLRVPQHPLAVSLISAAGLPIAAPSANRFGHVSPTRASHVLDDLSEKGVRVLNGENEEYVKNSKFSCEFGIESTVIKLEPESSQISIFRQGGISQNQLQEFLNSKNINWTIKTVVRTVKMHHSAEVSSTPSLNTNEIGQIAPGQAVTHYAPDIPCYMLKSLTITSSSLNPIIYSNQNHVLVETNSEKKQLSINLSELKESVIIIDFNKQLEGLKDYSSGYYDLSPSGSASEAAYQLFHVLRWTEEFNQAKMVFIATIPKVENAKDSVIDITLGLVDRIFRATSGVYADITIE